MGCEECRAVLYTRESERVVSDLCTRSVQSQSMCVCDLCIAVYCTPVLFLSPAWPVCVCAVGVSHSCLCQMGWG